MNPYPRIIVCTVFGERCRASVLRNACYLAKCSGARLLVANVVDSSRDDGPNPSYENVTGPDTLTGAPLDDVHYEQFTVRGRPADGVSKFAVEMEADMVVIGNDVGCEGAPSLGVLTREIVDRLPCTVVVVKDEDDPFDVSVGGATGSCVT